MKGLISTAQARAAVGIPTLDTHPHLRLVRRQDDQPLPLVTQRCIHCQHQWPATPFHGQLSVRCPDCGEPTPVRRGPQP